MTRSKRYVVVLAVMVALLLPALVVNAQMKTFKGKIEGFLCVVQGYACPVDKADPMIAVEKDFVLVLPNGTYYLMPNVPFGVKARHALDVVEVSGTASAKYKSIEVDTLSKGGKVLWSKKMEQEMRQRLESPYPSGGAG
jgi:hypothetical protein